MAGDSGPFDSEDISDAEAVAAALAGLVATGAAGALTLAEARENLGGVGNLLIETGEQAATATTDPDGSSAGVAAAAAAVAAEQAAGLGGIQPAASEGDGTFDLVEGTVGSSGADGEELADGEGRIELADGEGAVGSSGADGEELADGEGRIELADGEGQGANGPTEGELGTGLGSGVDDVASDPSEPAGASVDGGEGVSQEPEASDLAAVSQTEIDDIYERGLASGRSLDDLREDVAGLRHARGGGPGDDNPYGLELRETAKGPAPLTPGEFSDYQHQKAELARLKRERENSKSVWSEIQEGRADLSLSNTLEIWAASNKYQDDIAEQEAWIRTLERWSHGDPWRSPDGLQRHEQTISVPRWGDGPMRSEDVPVTPELIASRLEGHREARQWLLDQLRNDINSIRERATDIELKSARLDELQEQFLQRRRALDFEIDNAQFWINDRESWASGRRPLPEE